LRFSQSRNSGTGIDLLRIKRYAQLNKKFTIASLNKFYRSESDDESEGQGLQIVNEKCELELTDN
jgi:hypothetical protein